MPPATLAHLLSVVSARRGLGDQTELSSLRHSAGRGLGAGECTALPACIPACAQRLPASRWYLRRGLCSTALGWHPHRWAPAECGGSLVKEKITELKEGPELPGRGGGLLFQVPCAPG